MPPLPPDQVTPFPGGRNNAVATISRRPAGRNALSEPGSPRGPPTIAPLPPFAPVKQACVVGGFGRSKLYEIVGLGLVRAVKLGSKTLIDTASLLAYLESLPAARIKPMKIPTRKPKAPAPGDAPEVA